MSLARTCIVVADANVLNRLMQVARLGICARLPGLTVMVPEEVNREIIQPEKRAELDDALESRLIPLASITDPADIVQFADLCTCLGRGEAACLVLAQRHGWTVASDERRRFRHEASRLIGEGRVIGTADLFVRAIQAGLITIEEADADKKCLEAKRFKMPFHSFQEKVRALPSKETPENAAL